MAEFYRDNLKTSWNLHKNTDTILNFSYLAIKLPNFKPVDEKLLELELWVSHSFDIKNSLQKNAFNPIPPERGGGGGGGGERISTFENFLDI